MKKLLLALLCGLSAMAQSSYSLSVTNAATNNIISTPIKLYSAVFANTGTNAVTFRLFDSSTTALVWTNAAWTVVSATTANVTNRFTNSLGGYQTNIYSTVLSLTTTTNAAATNSLSTLLFMTVPASTTVSLTPSDPTIAVRGITMTNTDPGVNTFTVTGTVGQ